MTETKYLPHAWLDEHSPMEQPDPNAFIFGDRQTGYTLKPVRDDEEHENASYHIAIEHGDEIAFDSHRNYGDYHLTVYADGEWSTPVPIPQDANSFAVCDDEETIFGTINEMIRDCLQGPGECFVSAWHWSTTRTMFRFEVQDGRARLVQIGGTQ